MSACTLARLSLVAALLLAADARAEDPAAAPRERANTAQSCAHHERAMQAMPSDKERMAYCQAHEDCVRLDCGGLAEKTRGPVDPPGPEPKAKSPPPVKP